MYYHVSRIITYLYYIIRIITAFTLDEFLRTIRKNRQCHSEGSPRWYLATFDEQV